MWYYKVNAFRAFIGLRGFMWYYRVNGFRAFRRVNGISPIYGNMKSQCIYWCKRFYVVLQGQWFYRSISMILKDFVGIFWGVRKDESMD